MHTKYLPALLTLTLACGGNQAVQLNQTSDLPGTRWQGAVSSPPTLDGAVEMTGTAWMAEAEESDSTTYVQVSISNAAPGGLHPWEVRRGQCGNGWGAFGDSATYEPLEVEGNGRASASAMINQPLPRDGEHSVAILASSANQDLIVACANLAPPVAAGFR